MNAKLICSSIFQHTNNRGMTEDDGRDYFHEFIYSQPETRTEEHKPDLSILTDFDLFVVATPKKPETAPKIHPFIQIANEKRTKLGIYADEIIDQRKRCGSYRQIALEEERKLAEKLNKKLKKVTAKTALRRMLGPKKPTARKILGHESQTEEEEDVQIKTNRRTGPPYMPNVICMDQLYSKNAKVNNPNKKKEKSIEYSRSRSKRAIKQKNKRDRDTISRETSPEKSVSKDKSQEKYLVHTDKSACKNAETPMSRLFEGNKEQQERYLAKRELQSNQINSNDLKNLPNTNQNKSIQEIVPIKRSDKLNLDSSNEFPQSSSYKTSFKRCQQTNVKTEYDRKIEKESYQYEAAKKREEMLKKEQEQKRRFQEQIQRKKNQLNSLEQAIKKRQRIQKQLKKREVQRQKSKPSHSKHSLHHRNKSPRSTNESMQQPHWRKEIQKITGYNPQDKKYKERDRGQIKQSNFYQMNAEEAYSRKMGKREEEFEELRHKKKTMKKGYF